MSSLTGTQEDIQKCPLFPLLTEKKAEVQEQSLGGLPTAVDNSAVTLFELDSKQVAVSNRWMSFCTAKD